MNQENDWIEAQLRARRIEPVRDDGFSERLAAQLHPHRTVHRATPRWIVPTLSGIGALLTGVTVPPAEWSSAITWASQPQSLLILALAATVVVWSGSAWALLDRRHRAL